MTEQPKPKRFTRVEAPPDLRQFLREVAELIDEGDEATLVESDDLLQCEYAFGGLADAETAAYAFTYFPRKGVKPNWEFDLSASEIREVAEPALDIFRSTKPQRC
jgi:hypothetical protein